MKKHIILTTIVLGMTIGAFAQGGGLFGMGSQRESSYEYTNTRGESLIGLPSSHGSGEDQNTDVTPLGSGMAILVGLGAAYAASKSRRK